MKALFQATLIFGLLTPAIARADSELASRERSGGNSRPGVDHWAFKVPQRSEIPRVEDITWVCNPIDAFILARLERENVSPSPEAERRTLIRRLSLDLTGLPPAPDEVKAFVNDPRRDAYEALVDRLLGSPHYGERWARHWLDQARYADSDGYEKDSVRPYAYLYRDWVIQALNDDMPFDRFTVEQIAGDLLPNATLPQKTATGFQRQTLTNKEGGVDQEEFRCKAVVDRVGTLGTVWLGLTMACAECHDHKYDPVTQREFYELFAFFNNASETDLPAPLPSEIVQYERAKAEWESEDARLKAELEALSGDQKQAAAEKLKEQLEKHSKNEPKFDPTKVMALVENDQTRPTHVHVRGDFLRKGQQVQPGVPSVLHEFKPRRKPDRSGSPDRLDLASWLVGEENPLTSRVIVNRIWQHLFGRALVTSEADFGSRGEKPSHPALLDWLACEFRESGWSQKAMIKLIVTSAAYRQSSAIRPELFERDPNNALFARQNRFRLEAETVRDVHLAVSGLLDRTIGGPSVRPPLPADIAALGYANSVKWPESKGGDKYRRGLYILLQRTVPYPMLAMFDAPDGNVTCTRRERSNTPLQALTLWNDPVFFECAQSLGRRLANEGTKEAQVQRLFEVCLARPPAAEELERLLSFYETQHRLCQANPERAAEIVGGSSDVEPARAAKVATLVALSRTVLNLDEFVTRE